MINERPGVEEIRNKAYKDVLKNYSKIHQEDILQTLRYTFILQSMDKHPAVDGLTRRIIKDIKSIDCNDDLINILKKIDEIYLTYFEFIINSQIESGKINEKDIKNVEDLSADNFHITLRDEYFTSRKDASTRFYQSLSILRTSEETKLGQISGFDIVGTREELRFTPVIWIKGNGKYKVEINNVDEIGNILKLENMLKSFENKISTVKEQIAYTEKQLVDVKEELDKPFTMGDRIKELQKEKARIDSELDLDKQELQQEVSDEKDEDLEI